jgi:hypothetical protein
MRRRATKLRALPPRVVAVVVGLSSLGACKDSTSVPDLNNVSSSTISNGLNRASVQLLVTGLLNQDRTTLGSGYILFAETMARDVYRIDPAEGRWITELVGHAADPSGPVGAAAWGVFWIGIRAANNIIDNISTARDLSAAERAATAGLAMTMKALSYYRALELRDSLGIPIAVNQSLSDPPAPFVCKPNVLAYISELLDSGLANLQAAGSTPFPFRVPSGFSQQGDYSTPSGFIAYNRGLKGKVELYRGLDHSKPNAASFVTAISALTEAIGPLSAATLNNSIYHVFSTADGDQTSPLVDGSVHLNPAAGDSIQAGDLRAVKIIRGVGPYSGSAVRTTYNIVSAITSNADNFTRPIPVLKVAELILLRAQARIESGDLGGATTDINFVRTNDGGLSAYPTFTSASTARSAVLYEKRYSLLYESAHRLVDLRAYSRLNAAYLKKERTDDIFQSALPIPQREVDGRGGVIPTPLCN